MRGGNLKILRLFLGFYILYLFAFTLPSLFGGSIRLLWVRPRYYLICAGVLLLGAFFGWLTIRIQGTQRPLRVYRNAQWIVSFVVLTLFVLSSYQKWKHERDFGNAEANADYFRYGAGAGEYEKQIAYDSLLARFGGDANAFRIQGSETQSRDTVWKDQAAVLYEVTYYYWKGRKESFCKAKARVLGNEASLVYFNRPLDAADLIRIRTQNEEEKELVRKALHSLPDSMQRQLRADMPEMFE